jgi:hypothetical protein
MTLEEAYRITAQMNMNDHRHPTPLQAEAKGVIYSEVIVPKFGGVDNVPPHLEPDYMEGWR